MNAVFVRIALVALRAYKLCISPYFRGSCRFLPSCADYAAEAIERHGVPRGSWLAARRLARCHPFCVAGHDPVPLPTPVIHVAQDFRLRSKLRRTAVASAQAVSPGSPAGLKPCATK